MFADVSLPATLLAMTLYFLTNYVKLVSYTSDFASKHADKFLPVESTANAVLF